MTKHQDDQQPTYSDNLKEDIKRLLPQAFTLDGHLDMKAIQRALGLEDDEVNKHFGLVWPGKEKAMSMVNAPHRFHLFPDTDKSVNFFDTQNVFIEADNLAALRLLQNAYQEQVKLIYIDPPYNTGKDFVYQDNFSDTLEAYLSQTEVTDREGKRVKPKTNAEGGRKHSNWLNFMYPRLLLARKLLKNTGLICISIDDNEQHHLRNLMDEIFGEENFIAQIAWRRTENQANIGSIARVKEYILFYAKSKSEASIHKIALSERAKAAYSYICEHTGKKFRRGILFHKTRGRHFYDVKLSTGQIVNGPWMVQEDKLKELYSNHLIYESSGALYTKIYLDNVDGQIPSDFWGSESGTNQDGTDEVTELFSENPFSFPKPTSMLSQILSIGAEDGDIILDFFGGSGSTGHATWLQNIKDSKNRRFVVCTLPEPVSENSAAAKAGYNVISEITIDRLRLSSEKVQKDNPSWSGDAGFRVFRLAGSSPQKEMKTKNDIKSLFEGYMDETDHTSSKGDLTHHYLWKVSLEMGYRLDAKLEEVEPGIWKATQDTKDGWIVMLKQPQNALRQTLLDAGAKQNDNVTIIEQHITDSDVTNCSSFFHVTLKRKML